MHGEDHQRGAQRFAQRRVGARHDRRHRSVPIVSVQHVRPDVARGDERGGAPEHHVAMQIVGVVRSALAVNSRAIETARMLDQVERDTVAGLGPQQVEALCGAAYRH